MIALDKSSKASFFYYECVNNKRNYFRLSI